MTTDGLKLTPERAGVIVVDIQDRLAAAMPDARRALVERRVSELLTLAKLMALPVLVTEQYPKGLGHSVAAVQTGLEGLDPRPEPVAKTSFDCTGEPDFAEALVTSGRDQWIVSGMETHVCVFQTARSLVDRGMSVHVPEDAVSSRRDSDQARGLHLLERAGATITCAETAIFDLLGKAGSPEFKEMSRLLREL